MTRGDLVATGGETPGVFQTIDAALDAVAQGVDQAADRIGACPVAADGDDGCADLRGAVDTFRFDRAERRFIVVIAPSFIRVLRRPIESAQFTSTDFIKVPAAREIRISMDGKRAWRDDVFVERLWRTIKYEEVSLRAYSSVSEKLLCYATAPGRAF